MRTLPARMRNDFNSSRYSRSLCKTCTYEICNPETVFPFRQKFLNASSHALTDQANPTLLPVSRSAEVHIALTRFHCIEWIQRLGSLFNFRFFSCTNVSSVSDKSPLSVNLTSSAICSTLVSSAGSIMKLSSSLNPTVSPIVL